MLGGRGSCYFKTRELRAVLNACSGLVSDQRVDNDTLSVCQYV
jgi:hypothetical protein